jgi:hypothetical protein
MLSPYQEARKTRSIDEPILRSEVLYGKRLLNQLRQEALAPHPTKGTLDKFSTFIAKAFPETVVELAGDVHSACDWSMKQERPCPFIIRAGIIFAGTLINQGVSSIALTILKKTGAAANADRELSALSSINTAAALHKMNPEASTSSWEDAITTMPIFKWVEYPSLLLGCHHTMRELRTQSDTHGDITALLLAGNYADRAYAAITNPAIKGTPVESSVPVVGLLIEIGNIQHATKLAGLPPLELPESTEIFRLAAFNAATNQVEPLLFPRTLTHLAQHYLRVGSPQDARDIALQALVELHRASTSDPELIKAIGLIVQAANETLE